MRPATPPRAVLLVHSSSSRYGADRQLELIARGAEGSRWAPLVVLPAEGELTDSLRSAGVEVLVRPGLAVLRRELMHPGGLAGLARAALADAIWLSRLIQSRGIALVHSNTSVLLGGATAARLARVPHVWHVREIYGGRFGRVWPAWRRGLLASADAIICVSQATAEQFGAGPERPAPVSVRVMYDGLAVAATQAPRAAARATLGLPADAPIIAVIGRISDWKGQDVLVRALAEPALRDRGVIGLLAGDAWGAGSGRLDRVLSLARACGVADRVVHLGFRDDVPVVLGAADLIAVPSTAPDPLPNSALEAAAAGCAVVAARHGGLVEIFEDGVTGRLVTPGDAVELAGVAAELLDDPVMRSRLGAAAAADVRLRFAPGRLLEGVDAIWSELTRAGGT